MASIVGFLITNIDSFFKSQIRLGNGAVVHESGKRTTAIEAKRRTKYIKDVIWLLIYIKNLVCCANCPTWGFCMLLKMTLASFMKKKQKSKHHVIGKINMGRQ